MYEPSVFCKRLTMNYFLGVATGAAAFVELAVGVRSLPGIVQAAWPFVFVVQVSAEAQQVED